MTEDERNALRAAAVREMIENDRELHSPFWEDGLTLWIVLLGVIIGVLALIGVLT